MVAVKAPWTKEQVKALWERQFTRRFHPYTCGECGQTLVPRASGWFCSGLECEYTQDWAHKEDMEWDTTPTSGDKSHSTPR